MYKNIPTQSIRNLLPETTGMHIDVLRCDLLHPVISGNKLFKLKYYLEEAIEHNRKGIITTGGAYSSHLVATAAACCEHNLLSIGIIRGEQVNNHSIEQMRSYGMELVFVSRQEYYQKEHLKERFMSLYPGYHYVSEGGRGHAGIRGAAEILSHAQDDYNYIVCAVGTGTTIAGLVNAAHDKQQVMGIPALKISDQTDNDLVRYLRSNTNKTSYKLVYGYDHGGYARKTSELISFMNDFYQRTHIPTDFVYTAKMMRAVCALIRKNSFNQSDKLLLIHTGGLQGNGSLPAGSLVF